ncbi:hypothetical protein CONLIGDRAFT_566173 [Coniochaeta ligniaria NRRL 30616]|uniref:Ubiquitin-conjugating enzyme E2-binding protein n=1 Tax=Coniochaeta ligniaria NRRL 30616 TaxID=1408157 RepID=A0A1J7J677_9PEZI|nr:hypothetical protein CONLIGDRAFT_566173 [Coniochaeta ligniaria NRRL 30616]
MATSHISIYAELLSNIRQVSLAVSLDSATDESTKVRIAHSNDTSSVHVSHAGETSHLTLPGRVSCPEGQELTIQRRSADAKVLTWRLPLVHDNQTAAQREGARSSVPWEARDLVPGSEVSCRKCQAPLVREGSVKEWKDLPAEGWAEMMEFWHCHKPGEEHHHGHDHSSNGTAEDKSAHETKADEETLASRGYGATSTITAQKGVGFVDLTTLLFAEEDCAGITFSVSAFSAGATSRDTLTEATSISSMSSGLNIFCTNCETRIGYFNYKTSAVTVFKWQVSCQTNTPAPRTPPTVPECLSATLSATISRTGSSKSLLLPINGLASPYSTSRSAPVLHFWILNPSLRYASTHAATSGPTPAMKLLYRTISREEADRILEDVNSDVQEVNLPEEAICVVAEALGESNALLPVAERRYREWTVGMLRTWEG